MLGKNSVVLCINGGQDSASYYYVKHRMPIQLARDGERWQEVGDMSLWELAASGSDAMTGTWRSPKNDNTVLPLTLALVSRQSEPEPCASDAYNASLEIMPQLQTGQPQEFEGKAFRTQRIADVETIELLTSAPALQAVNRHLKNMLPTSIEDLGGYFEKRREFLGRMGLAAEDETSAVPQFWSREFVTIRFNRWAAGFGRRGAQAEYRSWDLMNGNEVNLWDWFIATPKPNEGTRPHHLFKVAPPTQECEAGYYGKGEFQLTLEADAVRFWEEEYGDACEQEFRIPYDRLSPILSAQGKLAIARLLGKRKR